MRPGEPSRTALSAATHRAAHQIFEDGRIFSDPLAIPILGLEPDAIRQDAEAHPDRRGMRIFIAVRTRFTEDALAQAAARGTGQFVVLGAGLDTFAYRSPYGRDLRVFELDHPATQAWKRERLAAIGVEPPASLTYAPIDFERERLTDALARAGFDPSVPSFFSWLGVVPYLSEEAVFGTLAVIGGLAGGAEVVFDYGDPPETRDEESRRDHDARAAQVEARGEPWITYFEAAPLRVRLAECGFRTVEDLGPCEISTRFLPGRPPPRSGRGGHVIRAGTAE